MDKTEILDFVQSSLETIKKLEIENQELSKRASDLQTKLSLLTSEKIRLEKVANSKVSYSFDTSKVDAIVDTLLAFNVIEKSASETINTNLKTNPEYALDLINTLVKHASSVDEGSGVTLSSSKTIKDPHGWLNCLKD